jgi:hypothetical protein
MVSQPKGRTYILQQISPKDDICSKDRGRMRGIEKITQETSFFALFTRCYIRNVLKSSWAISCVTVELKINISELSSVSIIRVDVVWSFTTILTMEPKEISETLVFKSTLIWLMA